ncbi:UNVERIFIED_CONTAM: hypothetical protein PYX00_003807 [Menopon gallinae]|uniref:Serpin domain-containing protein n=1 Tax=Menopon gallinae TaxID=328185 RepID=A0AAW2I317_9NEOP
MDVKVIFFVVAAMVMESASAESLYSKRYIPSPDRYNYFDAELLEILSRGSTGNVLLSPLGVKLALAMLMEGAVGKTADEIRAALRLPVEGADLQNGLQLKLSSLKKMSDPSQVLKIASRIFAADKFEVDPAYRSSLNRNYGTDIVQVPFDRPQEATRVVNNWVKNATSGMIGRIVDESFVQASTKVILANAMYFKGKWRTPFVKENTVTKCFETAIGVCTQVPMMSDTSSYDYAYIAKLDAYAINIPYQGDRFSMLIVLPKKKNGCAQLGRDMIHVTLEEILSQLKRQEVRVEIPRFTVESNSDFVPYLERLQILQVFTPAANLTGISKNKKEHILVSNVFHSAKITVDEDGTEAAAAVGSLFVPLMGGTPTAFIADHPFLFFLRDTVTGTILFSGKIQRPTKETGRQLQHHKSFGQTHPSVPHTLGTVQQNDVPIPSTKPQPQKPSFNMQTIPYNTEAMAHPVPSFPARPKPDRILPMYEQKNPQPEGYILRQYNTKQMKYSRKTNYMDSSISFLNFGPRPGYIRYN